MSDLYSTSELQQIATQDAENYGVPTSLFLWQIGQESSWNPNAQNGDATGIAQFMPGTAAQFGINASDPVQSLNAAAQYDAQLYSQSGNWQTALTSYGTLANAPASVMSAFNSVMNNLGLPTSTTSGSSTTGTGTVAATSDSFVSKITFIVLAIVVIAAGLFLLGRKVV
jgi:hypothetical protein